MLTNVLLKSGAIDILESFLGERNVVLQNCAAEVLYVPSSSLFIQSDWDQLKLIRESVWDVDFGRGRLKGKGADHLIRVLIPLTGGQGDDVNHGQVIVWPGMHPKRIKVFSKSQSAYVSNFSKINHFVRFHSPIQGRT